MRVYCPVLAAALSTCVLACSAAPPQRSAKQELASVAALPNHDLDILFVVDSSGSMADEQRLLATNFPRFMQQLERLPGGLPNVHIGVVTPDLGTLGGPSIGGCALMGNGGNLLLQDLTTIDGKPFLSNIASANDPTVRTKNYSGELQAAFTQLASVGSNGCGLEQPLEAMKRALAPDHVGNAGFLRDSANLAIVIVTDEDDCSATGPEFYSAHSELGPLNSYRCFDQGVVCDDDELDPQRPGARTNCRPRPNATYQTDVTSYIDFLIERKGDERKVMVAGVIAPTLSTVQVEQRNFSAGLTAVLAASCERRFDSETSFADPAIRLTSFLRGFPGRSQTSSICDDDFSSVLSTIGASTARLMNAACFEQAPLLDDNGKPDCEVVDVSARSTAGTRSEKLLPACGSNSSEACYRIVEDTALCGAQPSQLRLEVQRPQGAAAAGYAVARCARADSL